MGHALLSRPVFPTCRTPGAVYQTDVLPRCIVHTVMLPQSIQLSDAKERALAKALHDAVLPVMEQFYRDNWNKFFAERIIDGDRMPKRWSDL